ncbi:MAG: sugar transferase [Ichthyobacteriaceae bacterium]|nr:sugar transferase [Ichthyobacteriaceae bacterium]
MSIIMKTLFDFIFGVLLLIFILPIIIILVVIATFSTRKFGVFNQQRVGKGGKLFTIYKIRSMFLQKGDTVTTENDPRITKFGQFLRKNKLDELLQLVNIVLGDMSFVGPRPDVEGYADKLIGDDKIILSVKPGITSPASLYFRNEEHLLAEQKNPIEYNDNVIWPKKIKLNTEYIKNWSFKYDMQIIYKTVFN